MNERIGFLPRWVHRAYAKVAGYFWLPCPLCGVMSGGHEWRERNGLPSSIPKPGSDHMAIGICPSCTFRGLGYERGRSWRLFPDGTLLYVGDPAITPTDPLGIPDA